MYNFKKEVEVYIVYNDKRYQLDLSEINFNQKFEVADATKDTIQLRELFPDVIVRKVLPATFSIVIPAIREIDYKVLFDRALDAKSFDIYIVAATNTFKVERAVITQFAFVSERGKVLQFSIQGEASKVVLGAVLSGSLVSRGSKTFTLPQYTYVNLETVGVIDYITTLNTELQNEIDWVPYKVLNDVCTEATASNFPDEYVLKKQILAGSIETYSDTEVTWGVKRSLLIKVGRKLAKLYTGLSLI